MASLVLYGSKQDWHVWKVLVTAKYANAKIIASGCWGSVKISLFDSAAIIFVCSF